MREMAKGGRVEHANSVETTCRRQSPSSRHKPRSRHHADRVWPSVNGRTNGNVKIE